MLKKIKKIKKIKPKDLLGIFFLLLSFPVSIIVKIKNKKTPIWLVCELKETSRDNGYHFFRYLREYHPEINCYYAISKNCEDYKKIAKYGNIIEFGSFRHWVYYLSAKYNISSHKEGNPNHAVFTFIHLYLKKLNNRVFLQHGITKDDAEMFYYKNTYFKYFICGAKKEYEYISERFGYPSKNVVYTGFARFDNLYGKKSNPKKILIMPTWRRWLEGNKTDEFTASNYFKKWNAILKNKELIRYLEVNQIELAFYPHYQMRMFVDKFNCDSKNIKILDSTKFNVQDLLIESSLLITDYSSVYMDFAYMRKPVIYYQFDYDDYRKSHFAKGYFEYKEDGFGSICENEEDVVKRIINYCNTNYNIEKKYLDRMNNFFEICDNENCKRIFEILIQE